MKNKVENINEYINWVEEVYETLIENGPKKQLFFRGHSDSDYKLLPSVFREPYTKSEDRRVKSCERTLFLDYMQYAPVNGISFKSIEDCEKILADMQHNEIPTRFLDWSLNPLIALYFACQKSEGNGKVYMFNPWNYNSEILKRKFYANCHDINSYARSLMVLGWDKKDILSYVKKRFPVVKNLNLDKPYATIIPFINSRKLFQKGCFTIHGTNTNSLESFKEFNDNSKCIEIDKDAKEKILFSLNILGINDYAVYPDFQGMSKMMKDKGSLFNLYSLKEKGKSVIMVDK